MAFIVRLIEGSEPDIDLFYLADDAWSMLEKGLVPNDPERFETYGGRLEDQLVRQEDGKRIIPLRLYGEWATPDALVDGVNALEKRLRHAARYRKDGWGDEVFLRFQLHDGSYAVDFPVLSGQIDKSNLLELCNAPMDAGGHREVTRQNSVGVNLVCEPYWESTTTYTLENYVYNPGFWRGAVAPGDSWTEWDPGAVLTLSWNTTVPEVMGRCLRFEWTHDPVNAPGIISDAFTVLPNTNYYWEMRGYHTLLCNRVRARVFDLTGGATIAGTVLEWTEANDDWIKKGTGFITPAGCISARIEIYREAADSTAGNKIFMADAVYLTPGIIAPVGWSSGRNLVNCLDATADNINVLCVTEIPGEVEAEIKATLTLLDDTDIMRVAKRTRNDPYNFIWELNAADAVVTAGDANCIDSALAVDATAPGGQRVTVTFAGTQTMALRCYWDITADLASYYGKFALLLIAKMEGATDTATIKIDEYDETANMIGATTRDVSGTSWTLYDGWEVLGFRIGTHDNDLFGTGNNWRIRIQASTDGTPTDDLHIASAFLVALDEAYFIAGGAGSFAGGSSQMILKDMDGDRGMFAYGTVSDTYYPNLGGAGSYPHLTPEIENWLYFVSGGLYVLDDAFTVALEYRPRGIFLRGTNPG